MNDPKPLIKRFVEELWNERRRDVADEIFTKDCVTHQLRSGAPADAVPRGPEEIKVHVADWIASFPDLRFSIEQMLSEEDRICIFLPLAGIPIHASCCVPSISSCVTTRMVTGNPKIGKRPPLPFARKPSAAAQNRSMCTFRLKRLKQGLLSRSNRRIVFKFGLTTLTCYSLT